MRFLKEFKVTFTNGKETKSEPYEHFSMIEALECAYKDIELFPDMEGYRVIGIKEDEKHRERRI